MKATCATTLHRVPLDCPRSRSPLRSAAGSKTWLDRTGHHQRRRPCDAQPLGHPSRISRKRRFSIVSHFIGHMSDQLCLRELTNKESLSVVVNNLDLNTPRYTLKLNSTECRRNETFSRKTVSKSREVSQDAVMALSLPEHAPQLHHRRQLHHPDRPADGRAAGPLEQLLSDANSAPPPRPYLLSPVEMFQTSPNLSSTTPKCAPHGAFANGIVTLPPPRVSFAMSCSPSSVDSTPAVKPKKRRAPACWSCPAGRRRRRA